ncbi:MAG: lipopolysaccharide heptosyltransferase I [Proteobacteria bacterium SG_bin9]|nr:MAG: lipopolysaccharide heptosyltransferase I [Proteobacteria bacterium SG_bin9]
MRDILFVKTSSLGDVVHHMPAVTDAARHCPGRKLSWIVEEDFAPLARLHPAVSDIIPVAARRWRSSILSASTWNEMRAFTKRLRERSDETIIDTQGLIRSALIVRRTRGEKHGYDSDSIREPLASRVYDIKHKVSRTLHAVTRNRALTALALGYTPGDAIDYGLPRAQASSASPYAILQHGTSREAKQWREVDWIGIGQWLSKRGFEVVIPWGSQPERVTSERLAAAIKNSRILPRQPLDLTARTIASASLVVGVDTGLLHLAAAYGVPLIAIFIATEPGLTGPVGQGPIRVLGGKGVYPSFVQAIAAAEALLG